MSPSILVLIATLLALLVFSSSAWAKVVCTDGGGMVGGDPGDGVNYNDGSSSSEGDPGDGDDSIRTNFRPIWNRPIGAHPSLNAVMSDTSFYGREFPFLDKILVNAFPFGRK
jgi:hypothetical protein